MASVRLDGIFAEFVPKRNLTSDASSLEHLLEDLESRYPRLRFRIRDETGAVRRFIRVFVNGQEVPRSGGLSTPIGPSDSVDVLHSTQGG